jgi:hypothetical protein
MLHFSEAYSLPGRLNFGKGMPSRRRERKAPHFPCNRINSTNTASETDLVSYMKVSPKQMEAVFALPGPKRFEHFIKVIADWQEVWGLYQDGWALCATDDGTPVFPFWPAREYAQACVADEWTGYEPRSMSLSDFTGLLLPKLKLDNVLPGVFFTPSSKGATPSIEQLQPALEAELQKYSERL